MPTYRVEYLQPAGGIGKDIYWAAEPVSAGRWITVAGMLLHVDRVTRAMRGDRYDGTLLCTIATGEADR